MIQIIRLTSGEEVLADIETTEEGYKLRDAALIVPTENGIGLMDWMAYSTIAETPLFIEKQYVMFTVEPIDGLRKQYQSAYSKVITPDKKLII